MAFPLLDLSAQLPRGPDDIDFAYNMADIDAVSDALGIPWEKSKESLFSVETPFTGFLWNLDSRPVSIPLEKAVCYLQAVTAWQTSRVHSLEDVQKLYGKLLHTSLVLPPRRAYLTGLEIVLPQE